VSEPGVSRQDPEGRRLAEELSRSGVAERKVGGDSMAPTLRQGSRVTLVPPSALHVGDIVVLELGGRLFTHRLTSLHGDTAVCRGDNRRACDPPVPRTAVLARVALVDGRATRGGAVVLIWSRLRFGGVRAMCAAQRLAAEMRLLWLQMRGEEPTREPSCWGMLDPAGDSALIDEEMTSRLLAEEGKLDAGGGVVVPAGIYGALSSEGRAALLRALRGHPVTLWAPRAVGRRVAIGRAVRRLAGLAGRRVGEPGDMIVTATGRLRPLKAFTCGELECEVSRAGGEVVDCQVVDTAEAALIRVGAEL